MVRGLTAVFNLCTHVTIFFLSLLLNMISLLVWYALLSLLDLLIISALQDKVLGGQYGVSY